VTFLDPEYFFIQERDGLRLITPKASAVYADQVWTLENLHYRSRLETLEGETVSQGFKKFMNLGQGPEGLRVDAADVVSACILGDAVATIKLDGSLIVRSVYQGRVLLRTRGAFGYQHQENAHEIETCVRRYPRILDPTYLPDTSLLFEWLSPANIIILKYDRSELFLVGGVRHPDLRYVRLTELQEVATYLGVPLVEFFLLDHKGWEELYDSLAADTEKEGYVIRLHDEQTLVKVKCAPYLAKHAFKYSMSTAKIVDMWLQSGRPSERGFLDLLTRQFDEEIIMWALPFLTNFFGWVQAAQEQISSVQAEVERCRELSRKDFALRMRQQLIPRDFSLAMLFWDGKDVNGRLMRQLIEDQIPTSESMSPTEEEG
jgi:hypothetical protein